MPKSFVERLTVEQINNFITEQYPNYRYNFYMGELPNSKKRYISVHIYSENIHKHYMLFDYEAILPNKTNWFKFLYKVFGEEYKKAYLKVCDDTIFNT